MDQDSQMFAVYIKYILVVGNGPTIVVIIVSLQ
jgi:hypothetical protein